MNPFTILGISPSASLEEAKAAYRRLASKHHPDRGGDTSKFQELQAAWDNIEKNFASFSNTAKQQSRMHETFTSAFNTSKKPTKTYYGSSSFEDIKSSFKSSNSSIVHIRMTPIKFGQRALFNIDGYPYVLDEPVPNGWVGTLNIDSNSVMPGMQSPPPKTIKVQVEVVVPHYSGVYIQGVHSTQKNYSFAPKTMFANDIGEATVNIDLNAINLIVGGWFEIKDIFGDTINFRIPAGFNPNNKLRIAGAGYYEYDTVKGKSVESRAHMLVNVIPIYTTISKLSKSEIASLRKQLEDYNVNDSTI